MADVLEMNALMSLHPSPFATRLSNGISNSSKTDRVLESIRLEEKLAKLDIENLIFDYEKNKDASFLSDDTEIKVLKESNQFSKYKDAFKRANSSFNQHSFETESSTSSTKEEYEEFKRNSRESEEQDSVKFAQIELRYRMEPIETSSTIEEIGTEDDNKENINQEDIENMLRSSSFMDLKERALSVAKDLMVPPFLRKKSGVKQGLGALSANEANIRNNTVETSVSSYKLATSSNTLFADPEKRELKLIGLDKEIRLFEKKRMELEELERSFLKELEQFKKKKKDLDKKEKQIQLKEKQLDSRANKLVEQKKSLNTAVKGQSIKELSSREQELLKRENAIKLKETNVSEQLKKIKAKEKHLKKREQEIKDMNNGLIKKTEEYSKRYEALLKREQDLNSRDTQLTNKSKDLQDLELTLRKAANLKSEKEAERTTINELLEKKNATLEKEIKQMEKYILEIKGNLELRSKEESESSEYVLSLEICVNNLIRENYLVKYNSSRLREKIDDSAYTLDYLKFSIHQMNAYIKSQQQHDILKDELSRIFSRRSSRPSSQNTPKDLDFAGLFASTIPLKGNARNKFKVLIKFVIACNRFKLIASLKHKRDYKLREVLQRSYV